MINTSHLRYLNYKHEIVKKVFLKGLKISKQAKLKNEPESDKNNPIP